MLTVSQPALLQDTAILSGSNQLSYCKSNERLQRRDSLFFPVEKTRLGAICGATANDSISSIANAIIVQTPNGGKIVNTCSDTYALKTIEEILLPIEEVLDKEFDYSAVYRHHDHARFYVDYIIHKALSVGDETDIILPKIRVQHSYSGDVRYEVLTGFYRQICSNGLSVLIDGSKQSWKSKHTTNKLDLKHSMNHLLNFVESASDYKQCFEVISEKVVLDVEERLGQVIAYTGFPKGLLEQVSDRIAQETNLGLMPSDWLVYNGFNYVLNHNHTSFNILEQNRNKLDHEILGFLLQH